MFDELYGRESMLFDTEFSQTIHREGAQNLLSWLHSTTFFDDPASTKYHENREGGLARHSLRVYYNLYNIYTKIYTTNHEITTDEIETIAICGLLHDICKIGVYKSDYRNVKKYDFTQADIEKYGAKIKTDFLGDYIWVQAPTYQFVDDFPIGHGEKSVYLIQKFMKLKDEEAIAIRWHMSAFGSSESRTITDAYNKFPLAFLLSMADQYTTFIDEKELIF